MLCHDDRVVDIVSGVHDQLVVLFSTKSFFDQSFGGDE